MRGQADTFGVPVRTDSCLVYIAFMVWLVASTGKARPALQQAVREQSLAAVPGGIDFIPCGEGEDTARLPPKTPTRMITRVGGQTCQNGNVNEILDTC